MSEWTVENIRLTLYNGDRKERVIVQKSNGDLTVTSRQKDKDEGGATDDKPEHASDAKEAGAKTKAAAQKPAASGPAKERKRRAEPPPPAAQQPARKDTSLEWAPIVDAGYEGFAAKSHGAEIHVLNTTKGGWAIYVFWGRGSFKHIACHAKLEDAKTAAQALHDEGLPPRPEPRLTQEMIDNACPAPAQADSPPRPPRKPRAKQETEAAQEPAPPRPPRKPRAKKADAATEKTSDAPGGESDKTSDAPKPAEAPTELTPELRTELRNSFKDAVVEAMKQGE